MVDREAISKTSWSQFNVNELLKLLIIKLNLKENKDKVILKANAFQFL